MGENCKAREEGGRSSEEGSRGPGMRGGKRQAR